MASIRKRTKKDGTSSFMVCWRDPKSHEQQGLTVASQVEAETLKRLLDANGQSFEIAQHAILSNQARVPTVAEVIQEHIGLLVRPSRGTTRTYQVMLDLHVRTVIGHVSVDKLGLSPHRTLGEVDGCEGPFGKDDPQRARIDLGGHEYR